MPQRPGEDGEQAGSAAEPATPRRDRVISSRAHRTAQLAGTAATVAARGGAARMLAAGQGADVAGSPPTARRRAAARQQTKAAEALVRVLGRMRGGAMKLGQLLSAVDMGLLPAEIRGEVQTILSSLQQSAEPVSFRAVERVLTEELGRPPHRVFAEFDEQPLAAASVGQVHRATLREDGRQVAVKVQYPGVAEAILADMRNLRLGLRLMAVVAPSLDTAAVAEELRERMTDELDYELEAATHARFAQMYRGHPFIVVPEVVTPLCRERVLVTEFVGGEPFTAVRSWPQPMRNRAGEILARFYVNGPARHGLLNGDPHPGNSLFLPDGRVAFLDFGFFKQLSRDDLRQIRGSLQAMQAGDGDALLAIASELGALPADPRLAAPFLASFQEIIGWMLVDAPVTVDADHTSAMMRGYYAMRHAEWFQELRVPPEHLVLLRVVLTLIGLLGQLQAEGHWHDMAAEWLTGAAPRTELGQAERAFFAAAAAADPGSLIN